MKILELDLHCGECNIIDYCPEYPDTPICAQSRFWDVEEDLYRKLAEETEASDDKDRAHKVYQKLLEEENQRYREALEEMYAAFKSLGEYTVEQLEAAHKAERSLKGVSVYDHCIRKKE